MEQWESPCVGSLRITNAKTLEKWIHNGNFKKEIDNGFIFNIGCGRFRTEKCSCSKCRKPNRGNELKQVINKHFKK